MICAAMDARGPTHRAIEKCPLHALPLGLIGACWAMVVAASLAIFIFRQGGSKKKSDKKKANKEAASKEDAVMQGTFGDGDGREPGTDLDAIVVGAGVAGAALAHTLGKVSRREFAMNICTLLMMCASSQWDKCLVPSFLSDSLGLGAGFIESLLISRGVMSA